MGPNHFRLYADYSDYSDSPSVEEFAAGKRLFDAETKGVTWNHLNSDARRGWALKARAIRNEKRTYQITTDGLTVTVTAKTLADAVLNAPTGRGRVISVFEVVG